MANHGVKCGSPDEPCSCEPEIEVDIQSNTHVCPVCGKDIPTIEDVVDHWNCFNCTK